MKNEQKLNYDLPNIERKGLLTPHILHNRKPKAQYQHISVENLC